MSAEKTDLQISFKNKKSSTPICGDSALEPATRYTSEPGGVPNISLIHALYLLYNFKCTEKTFYDIPIDIRVDYPRDY